MANIQSQIKRNRQNEKRHERNKAERTKVKSAVRTFNEAVDAGDKAAAEEAYEAAMSRLDKAASKGIIHKNKAANKKSRMAKQLQKL